MLTKIKKILLIAVIVAGNVFVAAAAPAMAADAPSATGSCSSTETNPLSFFPAWYDGLYCGNGVIKSPGDTSLGKDSGTRFATWLSIIAMNIVRMLLYVVGYASVIFIIYGGFKYMIQGDSSSGTVSARKTIQNAVIGLVISIMSVSIVTFVVQKVSTAGTAGNCSAVTTNATTSNIPTVQIKSSDLNSSGNLPCSADASTIGNLLGIAYLVAGMVAVLAIVIGGIRYATANGDSGQIQSAKNMVLYAVVGLVVVIMASAITNFVLTQVTKT